MGGSTETRPPPGRGLYRGKVVQNGKRPEKEWVPPEPKLRFEWEIHWNSFSTTYLESKEETFYKGNDSTFLICYRTYAHTDGVPGRVSSLAPSYPKAGRKE